MSKVDDIDRIFRAIKDAEIRLGSISSSIEQIDKEIAILTPRKNELEQNLEFHKKQNTVPLVQEHRKSKNELSKTIARLILITADHKRAVQACADTKSIIENLKKDHDELLRNSENNVLKGLFGVMRGKK